jgi:hypothetical protein
MIRNRIRSLLHTIHDPEAYTLAALDHVDSEMMYACWKEVCTLLIQVHTPNWLLGLLYIYVHACNDGLYHLGFFSFLTDRL